jgi:DNA primase large subunit
MVKKKVIKQVKPVPVPQEPEVTRAQKISELIEYEVSKMSKKDVMDLVRSVINDSYIGTTDDKIDDIWQETIHRRKRTCQ